MKQYYTLIIGADEKIKLEANSAIFVNNADDPIDFYSDFVRITKDNLLTLQNLLDIIEENLDTLQEGEIEWLESHDWRNMSMTDFIETANEFDLFNFLWTYARLEYIPTNELLGYATDAKSVQLFDITGLPVYVMKVEFVYN